MRHVALVRQHVDRYNSNSNDALSAREFDAQEIFRSVVSLKLLIEMVQRSVKHLLRRLLSSPPSRTAVRLLFTQNIVILLELIFSKLLVLSYLTFYHCYYHDNNVRRDVFHDMI